MREIDRVRQLAHMRNAGQRQREVAAPGIVDLHVLQLRKGFQHIRPNDAGQVCRILAAITDAAAIEQPVIGRAAIVVEHVIGILDAVIGRQQFLDQLGIERFRRHHLGGHRHHLLGDLRRQPAHIGIAADQHEFRPHHAALGAHIGLRAGVDFDNLGVFKDLAAKTFHCGCLAEHQVERMDMAAMPVDHAADIAIGLHVFRHLGLGHHFQTVMAVLLPGGADLAHFAHLLVGKSGKEAAIDQIAVYAVFRHPLANDPATLERHLAEPGGTVRAVAFGNRVEIAAVAVDDLPAIAAGRAKADAVGLDNDHRIAGLRQLQGRRDPGEPGADHADIGVQFAFQAGTNTLVAGRGCVVGGRMAGIGSDRLGHGMHLTRSGYRRHIRRLSHAGKTPTVPAACRRYRARDISARAPHRQNSTWQNAGSHNPNWSAAARG